MPYQPKHWLKVAAEGVKPDDLVFVVGYPGRTQRHQTHAEVKATTDWSMPRSIRFAEEQLAILDALDEEGQGDRNQGGGAGPGPEQRPDQHEGRARGAREGRQPGAQAAAGKGAGGLDRRPTRPGARSTATCCLRCRRCTRRRCRRESATPRSACSRARRLTSARRRRSTACHCSARNRTSSARRATRSGIGAGSGRGRSGCSGRSIPTVDRALLAWAMSKAAALPAAQRIEPLDKAVGAAGGHVRGGARSRRSIVPRPAVCRDEAGGQRLPPGVAGQEHVRGPGRPGSVHRPGRRARAPRGVDPRGQRRTSRALTPGCGRATWRRCWRSAGGLVAPDANSTLRVTYGQVKGVRREGRPVLRAADDPAGHRREAHGRGRLRRAATRSWLRSRR